MLVLPDRSIIDESYDVMLWGIQQNDPNHWSEVVDHPIHEPLQKLKSIRVFKYQENSDDWAMNRSICEDWLQNSTFC